ncbi:hypothetical protein ACFSUS_27795 [Spirosoma soli]|uniref:Uncharacterized protein n=1 Tax=Spirosoma soli TaxID=1770529 RepID=A0ABW5MBU2_9BACT
MGVSFVSRKPTNEPKLACRGGSTVDCNPPLNSQPVWFTQRQQGLMADGTGSNNKSSINLYTPVWLGCLGFSTGEFLVARQSTYFV